MTSPLLALFSRSLREDSRSKATFWARGAVGSFIVLVLLGFALANFWAGAPGRSFFTGIVILQIVSISLMGLSYFASAVAEEKEEQTLGLLRMTNLNPLSILLGKSTSRLCGALFLLVAQFPFTVFAVTLGGVSLLQIVATYCTLAAYLFMFCNVALLGSVLAPHTTGAAAFSVVVMGLFLGGGPLLSATGAALGALDLQVMGKWLWETTCIARLQEVLGTGFEESPAGWQVGSNLAVGAIFFLLAWAAFERFCDQTSGEAVTGGPVPRLAVGVRLGRPPRLLRDALAWKDYHFLCGGRMGMIVRGAFYGGTLLFMVVAAGLGRSSGIGFVGFALFGLVPFVFSIDVAAMAVRLFRTELNEQTLSALAVLPYTMREIAYRKARACLVSALPGALSVVCGSLLALEASSGMSVYGTPTMTAVQMVNGWLSIFLLVHVAAWLSLHMKRGALPLSYILTQVLQSVISGFYMIMVMTALRGASTGMYLGLLGGGLCSVLLGIYLHRRIPRQLEILAGEG